MLGKAVMFLVVLGKHDCMMGIDWLMVLIGPALFSSRSME
jgi:hypothetical protein